MKGNSKISGLKGSSKASGLKGNSKASGLKGLKGASKASGLKGSSKASGFKGNGKGRARTNDDDDEDDDDIELLSLGKYEDCPKIRAKIMEFLEEELKLDQVRNCLHSAPHTMGKNLRIDKQGEIAPDNDRPYWMLNCQIQKNKGCTDPVLCTVTRAVGSDSEPTFATLVVQADLEPSKEDFIDMWRQVMTPWAEGFKNKGWVTKDRGLELADAGILAKLAKLKGEDGEPADSEWEEFGPKPKPKKKHFSPQDNAKGKYDKKVTK